MDDPPTLVKCSVEIQKTIADQLHVDDITTYRLVSRDMLAATEDIFLGVYLSNLKYVYSTHGLETWLAAFLGMYFSNLKYVYTTHGLGPLASITKQRHLMKKLGWPPFSVCTSALTDPVRLPASPDNDTS
ncbi:hypothetical protein PRZ48_011155 [Zasmidium cellare]|uniref:Uncharacterized protein n=1 Tax=Zasmidium cellare TaxID=395010 RepID=A0ABR0EAL2_ZASCE|nr:hypothetical protein PRZ48_011155 [Zasmidium cellare]